VTIEARKETGFSYALLIQLGRGVIGVLAVAAALWVAGSHWPAAIALSTALFVVSLVAWRGCPTCWLMGLLATLSSRDSSPRR
jgi:hypothetical protein